MYGLLFIRLSQISSFLPLLTNILFLFVYILFIHLFMLFIYLWIHSFIHFFFFFSLAPSVFNLLPTVKIEKHIQLFLGLNSFAYYLFLRLLLICLFTYLFIYLSFPHIIFPHLNSPNIPFPGFLISPFVRFSVFPIRPKMPGCSRWVHSSLLAAWLSITFFFVQVRFTFHANSLTAFQVRSFCPIFTPVSNSPSLFVFVLLCVVCTAKIKDI